VTGGGAASRGETCGGAASWGVTGGGAASGGVTGGGAASVDVGKRESVVSDADANMAVLEGP